MPHNWRELNEQHGLLSPDDCRTCSGMGRVPEETLTIGPMVSTRYRDCPTCKGTGKKSEFSSQESGEVPAPAAAHVQPTPDPGYPLGALTPVPCHATGCDTEVPPRMAFCYRHWHMVPLEIQRQIWSTYRRGQEVTRDPSPEYLAVMKEAIAAVARKEART